jgi:hypothetical protein
VSLDGSSAEREALAVGMTCDIEYDPNKEGNEPSVIACKN